MKKMSIKQVNNLVVESTLLHINNKELRLGQSFMIKLHELNPTLYNSITNTDNDPFFDDKIIKKFLKFINE